MAATSMIEGVFCAAKHKTWDSFKDQNDVQVNAGESLVLWVVTPADPVDPMCEIKVDREMVASFVPLVKPIPFGANVRLQVNVTRYGYKLVSLDVLQPAK